MDWSRCDHIMAAMFTRSFLSGFFPVETFEEYHLIDSDEDLVQRIAIAAGDV